MRFSRMPKWTVICLSVASAVFPFRSMAQQTPPTLLAGLRPTPGLRWQRTSPTAQQPDGPVLYQLLFSASGTPGTVPAFDTNPRHLTNSPITVSGGNVVIGGGNGVSINGTNGIITFAAGQTFPGTTGVNSVTAGNGFITIGGTPANPTVGLNTGITDARYLTLTGGTMTGNITFAAGQTFPASGLPNLAGEVTGPPGTTVVSNAVSANTANAVVRRDGSGNFSAGTVMLSGNLTLPNTASASVGVLTLGGARFLHNFGTQNAFVGQLAGNLSMTGVQNSAFGSTALVSNTTGSGNSAFGLAALFLNTTGFGNAAFGNAALQSNTAGAQNSAFGSNALGSNTTANENSAFGANALRANSTGVQNSAFGTGALQNTTANSNSAFGYNAMIANTGGFQNSAFGALVLDANTTGVQNSAFGNLTLHVNTTGGQNSAFGISALNSNSTGSSNSAFGRSALQQNTTGGNNSGFGFQALLNNSTGVANVAFGGGALQNLTSGDSNAAIGVQAGVSLTTGSNNIYIANPGVASESNTIRIGNSTHTAAFMAGINGATSAGGVAVFVNGSGQLGTTTSSRRYKEQIADLGSESNVLMKLRPVAFYYKPELDSTHTRQYGLVAEEVAQIAPGLVVFDDDGQPQTVRYHFVNAMLLNEVQKQQRLIDAQQSENEAQQKELIAQQQQIASLRQQIQAQQKQIETVMLRLANMERSVQPSTQLAGVR